VLYLAPARLLVDDEQDTHNILAVVFAVWTAVDVSAYLLHAAFLGWVWASAAVHALGAFRPEYAPKHRSDAAA
jgi:hypothetical protein